MSGSFFHGIRNNTLPTTYRITQLANADVIVFVGLAPVGRIVGGAANVNKPFIASDPGTTIAAFGYDDPLLQSGLNPNFGPWSLSEAYFATFTLFNQWNKPTPIFWNIFDPAVHKTVVAPSNLPVVSGVITIPYNKITRCAAMIDSVFVKAAGGSGANLILGTDYLTGYDDDNDLLITILSSSPASTYWVGYNTENPSAVTASTVVGGTLSNGQNTGLEGIEDVWPQCKIIPGILYAPGWMNNTTVQAAADARVQLVDGVFKARTMMDIDDPVNAKTFQGAITLKGTNALVDSRIDLCWPPCAIAAGMTFHLGTLLAILEGVVTQTRANGVPYWGVSNNLLPITGVCLSDGTPITVHQTDALILNQNGIITVQQYSDGWYAWGNRTAAQTQSTDVTEVFSIVQREFDWIENSLALTIRPWVDNPTNGTLLQSILMSVQIWLSSLVSSKALLKGLIEFLQADNPISNLLMAVLVFHYLLTPPLPAEDITNNFEFDVSGLQLLYTFVSSLGSSGAVSGGGLSIR